MIFVGSINHEIISDRRAKLVRFEAYTIFGEFIQVVAVLAKQSLRNGIRDRRTFLVIGDVADIGQVIQVAFY